MVGAQRVILLQPPAARRYDWYVDAEHGSDANSGKTPSQAFQSMGQLQSVMAAGQSVGLRRGSRWREQLSLPGAGCRVGAYGGGERPILDASDEIASGSWSKTAGRTYVYQCTVTPAWSGNDWLNAFEDGAYLSRAADLSACDAAPGSYFPSGSSGAITLYVHPTGNGNPASNGKTYEFTARPNGLDFYSHANCRVSGIHTRMQLNCDGSLRAGQAAILVNCLASYGSKHNLYFRTGSKLVGVEAQEAYYGTTSLSMFVGNDNTPDGEGLALIRCTASCATLNTYATGFFCHRNASGSFGQVTYRECAARNLNQGFTAANADLMGVEECTIEGCTYGVKPDAPLALDGLTVTGACTRVVDAGGVASVSLANIRAQVACNNSLLVYAAAAVALSMTGCSLRGTSFSGANRMLYLNHASITAVISGCTFGAGFSSAIYAPAVASLESDWNCFDAEASSFNLNGSTYGSVTAWKAAGKDAHSTVGDCE